MGQFKLHPIRFANTLLIEATLPIVEGKPCFLIPPPVSPLINDDVFFARPTLSTIVIIYVYIIKLKDNIIYNIRHDGYRIIKVDESRQ